MGDSAYDKLRMSKNIQEMSCSLITGVAKVGIIQPFDFIRYRIQSSQYSNDRPLKILKLLKKLINKEGLKVFLKGVNVTTFGVFTSSLIHFQLYQNFHNYFKYKFLDKHISNVNNLEILKVIANDQEFRQKHSLYKPKNDLEYKKKLIKKISMVCALAGFCSGFGLAILSTPIDNVKIKLQAVQNLQSANNKQYRFNGSVDCIKQVYSVYGAKGFFIALPVSIVRESIASTIYFGTFEYMKNKEKINYNRKKIKISNSFIYGAISGGINWIITLPIDIIKTKVISDTIVPGMKMYTSSVDCARKMFKSNGLRGFYSGFSVVFTRGLIVNGIVLTFFDSCRSHFLTERSIQ